MDETALQAPVFVPSKSKTSTIDTYPEQDPELTSLKSKYKTEMCRNWDLYGFC